MRFPFKLPTVKSGQHRLPAPVFTLFNLDSHIIQVHEYTRNLFKSLGLAVRVGCFPPPQHGHTELGWQLNWYNTVGNDLAFCGQHGIPVILVGDDICREESDRRKVKEIPWYLDAVEYVSHNSSQRANCVMLDVVDEADHQLDGWDPLPVVQAWRRGSDIPEAWPCLGGRGYLEEKTHCRALARWWPWWYGKNIKNQSALMERNLPTLQRDMFWSSLICGIRERSNVQPNGNHVVTFRGVRPRDVLAQMMIAAAYGASVFEVYSYHCIRWILQRLHGKYPDVVYTGIDFTDREFDFIKRAIDYIRMMWPDEHYVPTESGPWLFGRIGNCTFGVNRSQSALPNPKADGVVQSGEVRIWNL